MDVLGLKELATEAGVKDRTLAGYLARKQCPEPDYRLACGPVWRRETVQPWIDARDGRLERIMTTVDDQHAAEVSHLSEYLYKGFMQSKAETARRNVHNGKLRRMRARSGNENTVRRGMGEIPTVRNEARSSAARMLSEGQADYLSMDVRELGRRDWAARLLELRQANRTATADGIPW